ncbi:MAG TPA: DPP IV N-terminal domain-containing protein [Cerasibacillus sp.]|uniref:S9 family peptidase n=1 Tax=Cerasibacillus sp. TaxID=2498711 RepID=UPI002F3E8425
MMEKYRKAKQLIPEYTKDDVLNGDITPYWIDRSHFWYLLEHMEDDKVVTYVYVMAYETGEKDIVFNYTDFIQSFNRVAKKDLTVESFPKERLNFCLIDKEVTFQIDLTNYSYNITADTFSVEKENVRALEDSITSPNGHYVAYIKDYNVYIEDLTTHEEIQLTHDGEPYFDYGSHPESNNRAVYNIIHNEKLKPGILWSPNSEKILTYKLDQRRVRTLDVIQSVTNDEDDLRPRHYSYRYHLPGDEYVPVVQLYLCDMKTKTCQSLDIPEMYINFTPPFTEDYKKLLWSKNSDYLFIPRLSRDFKTVTLYVVDANTFEVKQLLEERNATFLFLDSFEVMDGYKDYAFNHALLEERNQFIWHSEKSGWSHLYLHDLSTGTLIRPLTSGHWVVRRLIAVDSENEWVYFTAGGKEKGRDPYFEHLYRVRLDGTDLTLLTPEDADHEVYLSPDNDYFIDVYSRIDLPPHTVLRNVDGRFVRKVAEADISRLLEKGYVIPKPIKVLSEDESYDIYGLMILPSELDEEQSYPMIDYAYGGPQTLHTPKRFTWTNSFADPLGGLQSLAQLGFVGVMIDGIGTPQRNKAFHDYSYQNLQACSGLKDHVHVIKELGKSYPYLDLERVGVWGFSGGGYATVRAMFEYPDFYKVGVSASGNHDQRLYNAAWVERYNGLYEEDVYQKQDNTKLAHRLQGKLLLAHGDLDDNVHISQTIRLIDALIKENKDFDFVFMPNEYHILLFNLYFIRKKWDFFVKHLLGVDPPQEYPL